jgi:IMP dehydrogenase
MDTAQKTNQNSLPFPEKYSYDDVLLQPGFADFLPNETDVSVALTPAIRLNVPVISAAMDTVTEENLAIALALEGGVGVIHRNMPPEEQARQVRSVKRHLNWIIDKPYTVGPDQTIGTVRALVADHGISGLPVVDPENRVIGIITSRDLRFAPNNEMLVRDIMTPEPVVEVGVPTIESAQEKFNRHKIEKLPVVDRDGHLTGLVTVKDMEKHNRFPHAATDDAGRLLVGAAVAPVDVDKRLSLLVDARVDFVVVDTAHGDSANVVRTIRRIKEEVPALTVVGGNVATGDGTRRLIEAGADIIKVGVGPGSICTTRIVAGIGMPQLSAVMDSVDVARQYNVPVIADGGIKFSGDITKALAAGAHAIMVGSLFAGLKEAPGKEFLFEGRIFKSYRGMGSEAAMKRGGGDRYNVAEGEEPVPEGVEGRVPYKGELRPYLHQLVTGLRKGMGYCGVPDLERLREYRNFVKITSAGLQESHVHDVAMVRQPTNYSRG